MLGLNEIDFDKISQNPTKKLLDEEMKNDEVNSKVVSKSGAFDDPDGKFLVFGGWRPYMNLAEIDMLDLN